MSQCQGFFSNFVGRDKQTSGKKQPVTVDISLPSPDWCQFHVIDGDKSARLAIPMTEFYNLVEKADEIMEANG